MVGRPRQTTTGAVMAPAPRLCGWRPRRLSVSNHCSTPSKRAGRAQLTERDHVEGHVDQTPQDLSRLLACERHHGDLPGRAADLGAPRSGIGTRSLAPVTFRKPGLTALWARVNRVRGMVTSSNSGWCSRPRPMMGQHRGPLLGRRRGLQQISSNHPVTSNYMLTLGITSVYSTQKVGARPAANSLGAVSNRALTMSG
jgi:hypothetical protein